jgi:hypothetical protein
MSSIMLNTSYISDVSDLNQNDYNFVIQRTDSGETVYAILHGHAPYRGCVIFGNSNNSVAQFINLRNRAIASSANQPDGPNIINAINSISRCFILRGSYHGQE